MHKEPLDMRIRSSSGCAAVLAILVFAAPLASACISGMPIPLKELVASADLVVEATVIADRPVTDHSFKPSRGMEVRETDLRIGIRR